MEKIAGFEFLISIINIHFILVSLFTTKIRLRRLTIICSIITLWSLFSTIILQNEFVGQLTAVFYVLACFILPFITTENLKVSRILYTSFFYIGVSNALFISCLWIARNLNASIVAIIFIDIFINLFIFLLCYINWRTKYLFNISSQIEQIPTNLKIILLASIWFTDALAFFLPEYLSSLPGSTRLTFIELSAAIIILLLGILWPLLITNNVTNTHYKGTLDIVKKQIDDQLNHYEMLVQANKDIRDFQHDFKHLKLGLLNFLEEKNVDEAIHFLQVCDKPYTEKPYIFYETGNPIADALISEKHTKAQAFNTKIIFDGIIPDKIIDSSDACVLLGNILDNALEACSILPVESEKTITIKSYVNNGFLFLTVYNPVLQNVQIVNNTVRTTKKNSERHGIGLLSIKRIVDSYDGDMEVSCSEKTFCISVSLDLNNVHV